MLGKRKASEDDDGLLLLPGARKSRRITLGPAYAASRMPSASSAPYSPPSRARGLNADLDARISRLTGQGSDIRIKPRRQVDQLPASALPSLLPEQRAPPVPTARRRPDLVWARYDPHALEQREETPAPELRDMQSLMRQPAPPVTVFDTPRHQLYASLAPSPAQTAFLRPFTPLSRPRLRKSPSQDSFSELFQFKPPPAHEAPRPLVRPVQLWDEHDTHASDDSLSAVGVGGQLEDPFVAPPPRRFDIYEDCEM